MRVSNHIPLTFTPEYIGHLKVSDFLGQLTEEEIPVAKKLGMYQWDAWMKEKRCQRRERGEVETELGLTE